MQIHTVYFPLRGAKIVNLNTQNRDQRCDCGYTKSLLDGDSQYTA